jgi:hypothetical protein
MQTTYTVKVTAEVKGLTSSDTYRGCTEEQVATIRNQRHTTRWGYPLGSVLDMRVTAEEPTCSHGIPLSRACATCPHGTRC